MKTGKFVISLDFELMWGVRDKRTINDYGQNILNVHQVIPQTLELFRKYAVCGTFSTVGFLFFKTKEELLDILTKTENGVASIVSSKNRYAKSLGVDIEDLSVNEVIDIIMETPRILKSPILVDDKRLQVGYKEDDIRAFLPRSIRNVENSQARMRAAL